MLIGTHRTTTRVELVSDDFGEAEDVWQFPESLLIHYLMRAAAGESVDLILLEMEANADHIDCGDEDD
jgi:hypothetical protein